MKYSFAGDSFEMKKKKNHFYLIRYWFIYFYLINKGFCPVREFVFCKTLDRIRRQNFVAKVAYCASIPKSNIKHLKLLSATFYQIFSIFLFHLKSSFCSEDILIFVFPSSPVFLSVSHCFRGCPRKISKFMTSSTV